MQSTGRLFAASRLRLSAATQAAASAISTSPLCLRCGRTVIAIPSASVRLFARKAKQTDEPPPGQRKARRSPSTAASDSTNSGGTAKDSEAVMRLIAQLPAADVPEAIIALTQRLASHKQVNSPKAAHVEVIQAEVEIQKDDEEDEADEEEADDDENEAEYAVLRARLAKEGVVRTEAGEEIMSMEEVERQLNEGGEEDDEEEEFVLAEVDDDDDDEEMDEQEDDDEQVLEEEEQQNEALQPANTTSTTASTSSRASASSSNNNTFWIQEHNDGTVTVTEWPFADDDDDDTDLADSYDLNMPPSTTEQSAIVGQAIGGEKLRRVDVLEMKEKDLQEHFTKGGGRGGQKVNKSSNCVHLHHVPTGTIVKCHATRSLAENRRIAREIMQGRLEELVLGPASKNAQRAAKIRKQKAKTRRRAAVKYGEMDELEGDSTTVDGEGTVVKQPSSGRGSDSK